MKLAKIGIYFLLAALVLDMVFKLSQFFEPNWEADVHLYPFGLIWDYFLVGVTLLEVIGLIYLAVSQRKDTKFRNVSIMLAFTLVLETYNFTADYYATALNLYMAIYSVTTVLIIISSFLFGSLFKQKVDDQGKNWVNYYYILYFASLILYFGNNVIPGFSEVGFYLYTMVKFAISFTLAAILFKSHQFLNTKWKF
ncbi:hypothetical protein JV173_05010 [Acholeplasma equirhinis]|uniref:hypothetical protein n=1 Tax=Acholeplasma equirhinis TaxID=555393 RepID=UPI00197A8F75|nr:hypothetical protein [Acholeplasma equirhinis]MBN3490872.1 hypothetical protein [Acholeplasma equirhinis]